MRYFAIDVAGTVTEVTRTTWGILAESFTPGNRWRRYRAIPVSA